jgi:hypothetical protein
MPSKVVLVAAIALAFAAVTVAIAGAADFPSHSLSTATIAGAGTLMITPARSGETLGDLGLTVTVTLVDAVGQPWPNYPAADVWLDSELPSDVALCANGSIGDSNSDANGVMIFSGAVAGGGATARTNVYFVNTALLGPPLPIAFNSPDINGDLVVDLSDFGLFGQDFGSDVFRSDLVHDGLVDLADFSRFGSSFGERCP